MLRKFLASVIFVVSVHAQVEKFEVIASDVQTKNNIMIATGNVVIFSPTYYITAQKVIYDKNKGTFELFEDVLILKNNNVQTKSDYSFLDVNTDELYQKPMMFLDNESSIWINSKDSQRKDQTIILDESIISSCDCVDPDWSFRVTSAEYDTENRWIDAYNTRLYVKDVPLLYTPYIGFSTDNRRRTGLLMPTFGYSSTEGAFYSQPIYFAPEKNYDLELIPQIRAQRGAGMYVYYRYADSINSMLSLSGGYFKDKKDYQIENGLRNNEHFGIDLKYERYNLFSRKEDSFDGLYVDINYLNDIEYKTLEDEKFSESTDKNIESKINYIYSTNSYFLGSYFRYYINTDQESNSDTLQELPKLQAHSYSRPLIFDKLLYSTDIKYTNHTRENGLKAHQYDISLPISYSVNLFDDYVNLTVDQSFLLNKFTYGNNTSNFDDATYMESNTKVGISSDLIKPYEDYLHTVNLFATYNHSDQVKKDGDIYSITNNSTELSSFPISKSSDSIVFGINQSLYDSDDLKQIVRHSLKQSVLYDEFDDAKFQNMENEFVYNYIYNSISGSVNSNLTYNHQDNDLIESSTNLSLKRGNLFTKVGHYMSKDTPNSGKDELESYNFEMKYKISDDYSIGYYTNYNIKENLRNKQALTFGINDKCWSFDIKYEKEITPASTSSSNPIEQDIIYMQLVLKPLGGFNQEYEVNRKER